MSGRWFLFSIPSWKFKPRSIINIAQINIARSYMKFLQSKVVNKKINFGFETDRMSNELALNNQQVCVFLPAWNKLVKFWSSNCDLQHHFYFDDHGDEVHLAQWPIPRQNLLHITMDKIWGTNLHTAILWDSQSVCLIPMGSAKSTSHSLQKRLHVTLDQRTLSFHGAAKKKHWDLPWQAYQCELLQNSAANVCLFKNKEIFKSSSPQEYKFHPFAPRVIDRVRSQTSIAPYLDWLMIG